MEVYYKKNNEYYCIWGKLLLTFMLPKYISFTYQ